MSDMTVVPPTEVDANWTDLYTHVAYAEEKMKQMKSNPQYGSREFSLAFTAIQESRHWLEEAPKPANALAVWEKPYNG